MLPPQLSTIQIGAIPRIHAALGCVAALATDLPALVELKRALSCYCRIDILRESGVIPLLLQSLLLTGNIDDNDRLTKRFNIICQILKQITHWGDGLGLLNECGTVEKLTSFLPHLSSRVMVIKLLKLVSAVASQSVLTASVRHAALAHLSSLMHGFFKQQDGERTRLANPAATRFYITLNNAIIVLESSAIIRTAIVPRLSYASVYEFVSLLRCIIRQHPYSDPESRKIRASVYSTLYRIFQSDNNDMDDVRRYGDLAAFVTSNDLDSLIHISDIDSTTMLLGFLQMLDDTTFACCLTTSRIELFLARIDLRDSYSMPKLNSRMHLLATLIVRFPQFAERLSGLVGSMPFFECIGEIIRERWQNLKENLLLPSNTMMVLNSMLHVSQDVFCATWQLFAKGAVKTCCALLRCFVVSDCRKEDTLRDAWLSPGLIVQILHVLCMIADTQNPKLLGALEGDNGAALPNYFVDEFIACRGPEALELLRYDACMQERDVDPVRSKLTQLHTLLVDMAVIAPEAAVTGSARMQTLAEMRTFTLEHNWKTAFDLHIACILQESGYPRGIIRMVFVRSLHHSLHMPVRCNGAPSPAALLMLQAKARERILMMAKHATDVTISARLCNPHLQQHNELYRMVIQLNDEKFPSNAAHFRIAAEKSVLGETLHKCFVPPGDCTTASLPFVSLYHNQTKLSCATAPLTLPESDVVYGEHVMDDTAIYPVGTVLMYARAVVPADTVRLMFTHDTPWFIVFKPCPASMLRGAVPVGRVTLCARSPVKRTQSGDGVVEDILFDAKLLQIFEEHCRGERCIDAHTINLLLEDWQEKRERD